MSKLKKIAVLLLIVAMFSTFLPNDLFVEAKSSFKDSVRIDIEELKKDEEFSVYFPYEIDNIEIKIPTGLQYIGYKNKHHIFMAKEDLQDVKGMLFYSEKQSDTSIDEGMGESVGEVGSGNGSGLATWESYKLGKIMWKQGDGLLVAIRFLAEDIDPSTPITIIDKANTNITPNINYIVYYTKTEENNIIESGIQISEDKYTVDFDDNGFECEISGLEEFHKDAYVYEIYYEIPNITTLSNSYIIKQNDVVIESGGYIVGDNVEDIISNKPEEDIEEDDVEDEEDESEFDPGEDIDENEIEDDEEDNQDVVEEDDKNITENNNEDEDTTEEDDESLSPIIPEPEKPEGEDNESSEEDIDEEDAEEEDNQEDAEDEEEDTKEEENEDTEEDIDDEPVIEEVEDDEEDTIEGDQTKEEIEKDEDTTEDTVDKIEKQDEQGEDVEEVDNVVGDSLPKTGEKKGYILFGVVVLLLGLLNLKTRG